MSCASVLFTLCTYTPHIAPQCNAPTLHRHVPQCPREIPKTRTKASGVLGDNTIVVNIGISILPPKGELLHWPPTMSDVVESKAVVHPRTYIEQQVAPWEKTPEPVAIWGREYALRYPTMEEH